MSGGEFRVETAVSIKAHNLTVVLHANVAVAPVWMKEILLNTVEWYGSVTLLPVTGVRYIYVICFVSPQHEADARVLMEIVHHPLDHHTIKFSYSNDTFLLLNTVCDSIFMRLVLLKLLKIAQSPGIE